MWHKLCPVIGQFKLMNHDSRMLDYHMWSLLSIFSESRGIFSHPHRLEKSIDIVIAVPTQYRIRFQNIENRAHKKISSKFGKMDVLRELKIQELANPKQCEICNKNFPSAVDLGKHIMSHTRVHPVEKLNLFKKFKCNHCTAKFKTKWNMMTHVKRRHDPKPYHCDKCDEKFESHRQLVAHKYVCRR